MSRDVCRGMQKPNSNPYWHPAASSRNAPLPHQHFSVGSSARPPPFPKPAMVPKREDAQPNEDSKAPRLRRPTEPPAIKPSTSLPIASTSVSQPAQNGPHRPQNHHQPARSYHPYRHPDNPTYADHWTRNHAASNLNRSTNYRTNTYQREHNERFRWSNPASLSSPSNPPAHPSHRQGDMRDSVDSYRPAAPDRRRYQDSHAERPTQPNSPPAPQQAGRSVYRTSIATASTSSPTPAPQAQSSSIPQAPTRSVHQTQPNAETTRPNAAIPSGPLTDATIQSSKDKKDTDGKKAETITKSAAPSSPLTVNTQRPSAINPSSTAKAETKTKVAESLNSAPITKLETESKVDENPKTTNPKAAECPRSPALNTQLPTPDTHSDDVASQASKAQTGTKSKKRALPSQAQGSAPNGKEVEPPAAPSSQAKPHISTSKEDARPAAKKSKITPSVHENRPGSSQTSVQHSHKSSSNRGENCAGQAQASAPQTSSSSTPQRFPPVQPEKKPQLQSRPLENPHISSTAEDRLRKCENIRSNEVLACCKVQKWGTRTSVADLISRLIEAIAGIVVKIEFVAFGGLEFKQAYLIITFRDAHAAHKALSAKWVWIPKPFLYMKEKLRLLSLKSPAKGRFMDHALETAQLSASDNHGDEDPWIFSPKHASLPQHEPSKVSAKEITSTKAGSAGHSQVNRGTAAPQTQPRALPDLSSKTAPGPSDVPCPVPADKDHTAKDNLSSKKLTTSLADKNPQSTNSNPKKTEPGWLDSVGQSDDRTPGKSSCKRAGAPSALASGSQPNQESKAQRLDPAGSRSSKLPAGTLDNTVGDSMIPSPSVDAIDSTSSCSHQLWVKIWCNSSIDHEMARNFIHQLFEPFGKNLIVKVVQQTDTPRVFHLIFRNSQQAERALQSMYGYKLPDEFVIQSDEFPRHLEVSSYFHRNSPFYQKRNIESQSGPASVERRQPRQDSIQPELCLIKGKTLNESSASPNVRISTPNAFKDVTAQGSSSSRCLDTEPQINTTSSSNKMKTSTDPASSSTGVTIQDHELAKFTLPEDPSNAAAHLPLQVVKHEMPQNCKEAHPSYAANRLHFKLDKIRIATSQDQTVLDSSWTGEHLILYVVPNVDLTASTGDKSCPRQDDDPGAPDACQESRHVSDPPLLPDRRNVEPALPVSSPAVVIVDDLPAASDANEKHRTWPFSPKPVYFDDSATQDLQKTLHDFLGTFFRLWEGSREDLRHLYDESAIFSNILAKQGRTASSITKSTGWPNIFKTIRKLPALSNEPLGDSMLDAWPVPGFPRRVLCVVHGTFIEFDKATKRAFDRTFVLRPVDVNLNPSEGCLGLLKWIILSDTLTIRKNSSQTTAVIEGFRQQRASQADGSNVIHDTSSPDIEENSHPNHPPSYARLKQARGDSPLSASSHSARLSSAPLPQRESSSTSSDIPLADMVSRSFNTPAQIPSTNRPTPEVTASTPEVDLVNLQAQLRVMQSEIERLKSASHVPNQATSTPPRQQSSHQVDPVSTPSNSHLQSRPSGRRSNSRPSNAQNNDGFEIKSSSSYLHTGLGVWRKRLLVPTDLSSYLVVSIRGDILSWDKTNRSRVQLLLSGASPTDLIDSACYSSSSKTLVVGSRTSPTARDATSPQISLVKMRQSSTGSLTCERVPFNDRLHEGGVRATCLLPQSDRPGMPLAFVTAGQEKHLVVWKIIRGYKETSKILSDHTSAIQTLAACNQRNWVLSGAQDGKVYATDMNSNHRRLLLAGKHPIIDLQLDEVHNRNNIMVTTGNKNPESQFRYCDIRMSDPVLRFGFPAAADGVSFDPSVKTHSKGSLMDNYFAHPTRDNGGVRIWDLRSTRTHLLKVSNTASSQAYFESLKTLLTMDKDTLTHVEFR